MLSQSLPLVVSIPFKREGLSEPVLKMVGGKDAKFQFPSNGKVFLNANDKFVAKAGASIVSIPFKREGLSEPQSDNAARDCIIVSIPFKREGLSEHCVHDSLFPRS